jgi:hypothetical protein
MIKPEEFVSDIFEMMARMIDEAVLAERDACAQVVNDDRGLSDDDAIRVMRAIRARGQA